MSKRVAIAASIGMALAIASACGNVRSAPVVSGIVEQRDHDPREVKPKKVCSTKKDNRGKYRKSCYSTTVVTPEEWDITVNGEEIDVSREVYEACEEGEQYRQCAEGVE